MALKTFLCLACETTFDTITGPHIAGGDRVTCACGSEGVAEVIGGGAFMAKGFDYDAAHPEEKGMAVRQRRNLEANAEQILSGEMAYHHPKGLPTHLSPQVPAHLQKRYY